MSYVIKQLPLRRAVLVVKYHSAASLREDFEALEERVTGIAFDHLGDVEVLSRKGLRTRKVEAVVQGKASTIKLLEVAAW